MAFLEHLQVLVLSEMAKGFYRCDSLELLNMEDYTGLHGWAPENQGIVVVEMQKTVALEDGKRCLVKIQVAFIS